jgi:prepilin-type N-terminal cleavage/methylation domain-containing protein
MSSRIGKKRRGLTLVETMLAVVLVSLGAGIAVSLVQLGNRVYEGVLEDSQQCRQWLRLAGQLRDDIHGASRAIVSNDGQMLTLTGRTSEQITFQIDGSHVTVKRSQDNQMIAGDRFSMVAAKGMRFATLDSGKLVSLNWTSGRPMEIVVMVGKWKAVDTTSDEESQDD